MFKYNIKEEELFALLESSMSDFENNTLPKIVKKVDKLKESLEENNNNGRYYISLTEGILFPNEIRTKLISHLRKDLNEFIYATFTYHNLFEKISAQPFNLNVYHRSLIEKIFVDSYIDIFSLHTELYKNIEKHLLDINIKKVSTRSQGVTINFDTIEELNDIIANLEIILIDSYNKAISEALRKKSFLVISFNSILNNQNFLLKINTYFHEEKNEFILEGVYKKFNIKDDLLLELISNIDKKIIKNENKFLFREKADDSIIFIPKNSASSYVLDYGYFNEKHFKKLIHLSRQNYNVSTDSRKKDYDYLTQNFKFI